MTPCRTPAEVLTSFANLSHSDLSALRMASARLCNRTQYTDPTDLLYEALNRTLDGRRKSPTHLPLLVFLLQVMRSIASVERQDQHRLVSMDDTEMEGVLAQKGENSPSVEDIAIATQDYLRSQNRVSALFLACKDDPVSILLLNARMGNLGAAETQAIRSLSAKALDAARKRVARKQAQRKP